MAQLQESEKCGFCRLKLRGSAREWLGSDPDLPAITSWEDLRTRLLLRFNPAADAAMLARQFATTRQKSGESVAAFAARLKRLGARWNEARGGQPSSTDRAARPGFITDSVLGQFLTGLDPRIRKYVTVK